MHGLRKQIRPVGYYAVGGVEIEVFAEPSRDGVRLVASVPVDDMNSPLLGAVAERRLTWDEVTDDTDWRMLAGQLAAELQSRHAAK